MTVSKRRILIGIGGGVAAYKVATVVSRLVQDGLEVQVAMTSAATRFVAPATFTALSNRPVAADIFAQDHWPLGPHIELADQASLFCVAPCTADLLSKFATGGADCIVSALYLQVQSPVLLAPAMSNAMWIKPSVQRNVQQLRQDGVRFIGPEEGWLSCRQTGTGRMAEAETIVGEILKELGNRN